MAHDLTGFRFVNVALDGGEHYATTAGENFGSILGAARLAGTINCEAWGRKRIAAPANTLRA